MWKEGNKIIFITKVLERNVLAISNAAVELRTAASEAPKAKVSAAPASLEVGGFGASQIFAGIQSGLGGLSKDDRVKIVKKTNAIFAFQVTNGERKTQAWFVDVKNGEGSVGIGAIKADMTIQVGDKDFLDLAKGTLQPQKAFMSGKIKIQGNMGLANKLEAVLKLAGASASKAKL